MQPRLIDMSVEQARREKWVRGQKEHGTVMALDPLLELHAECLDGINYTESLIRDESLTEGERVELGVVSVQLRMAAKLCMAIANCHADRHYSPQEIPFR